MQYFFKKATAVLTIPALMLLFTGCDISNSNSADEQNNRKIQVKMSVQSSSSPKHLSAKPSLQSVSSLTEVKLLVEELELESAHDEDSLDFEVDDRIINLPLDGSDFVLTSATVPEGLYNEFEMEIEQPDDDADIKDSDFYRNSGDDGGYSIVVKGEYNGEPFTYRSEEDFELELEFHPPLEVSPSSSPSVAIQVDPFNWFKDGAGNDLDPNDPANIEQIDENIEKSFEIEKNDENDDDRDDDDDSDDDNDDEDEEEDDDDGDDD